MVYARFASGYRPGGPNTALILGSSAPVSFSPDKTQNSEIGFKGDLFGRAISIDASVYYISWKDLQTGVSSAAYGAYTINVGQAKSQGAELSVESRPLKGLTVSAWGAWNLADLTKAFPPTSNAIGAVGDRLPYSARFSSTFSVRQEIAFEHGVVGFASASASYVGAREGEFIAGFGTVRQTYPAYTKSDLRAGATDGPWTTNVYVNNVSNQRGQLSGGQGTLNPFAFTYIQPRTIGLNVEKKF
jgi:iron complex outermembrane recepter protein